MLPVSILAGSEGFARGARGEAGVAGSVGPCGGERSILENNPKTNAVDSAFIVKEHRTTRDDVNLQNTWG